MDASYFDGWLRAKDAAQMVGVVPSSLYDLAKTHRIGTQLMFGRIAFHRADCERVRDHLTRVRAEREAKKQREAA